MNPSNLTFRADLHCHSTCSDGTFTPEELVLEAKKLGLKGLSITDHDTIAAFARARPLADREGIELTTGVEFSTVYQNFSIHVLGYRFDENAPQIQELCNYHRIRRRDRNRIILEKLEKKGFKITEELLKKGTPEEELSSSIGRPHIAQALVQKGYVSSIQEAFKRYIGEGKECYDPGEPFAIEETLDVIHQSKGLAIIAHPHLIDPASLIPGLIKLPFDGIECFYGNFRQHQNARWLKIAEQRNWLITGGSDFHGLVKPNLSLGASWIDEPNFRKLLNK